MWLKAQRNNALEWDYALSYDFIRFDNRSNRGQSVMVAKQVPSFEELSARQECERQRVERIALHGSKEERRDELEWQRAFVGQVSWQPQPRSAR